MSHSHDIFGYFPPEEKTHTETHTHTVQKESSSDALSPSHTKPLPPSHDSQSQFFGMKRLSTQRNGIDMKKELSESKICSFGDDSRVVSVIV